MKTQDKILNLSSYITLIIPIISLIFALLSRNIVILNYVHVITGGTCTGIDLFMGIVMTRVMKGLKDEARIQIIRKLVPIMLFLMPSLASVAITSGLYLAE